MEFSDQQTLTPSGEWPKTFRRANLYSQVFGLGVGAILSWCTLDVYRGPHAKFWAIPGGNLTASGWVYVYCITLLYALITVYVTRCICITFYLRKLVANAAIRMLPFHPDGCGGLQPVGRLGPCNQYILSILGMNIAVFAAVTTSMLGHARAESSLIAVAVVAYLVLGPTVFLGPLIPFREGMQKTKARLMGEVADRLRIEFERVRTQFKTTSPTEEDIEILERLKKLAEMINELPVWPFDARTLRRFSSAYLAPVLETLFSKAVVEVLPPLTTLL